MTALLPSHFEGRSRRGGPLSLRAWLPGLLLLLATAGCGEYGGGGVGGAIAAPGAGAGGGPPGGGGPGGGAATPAESMAAFQQTVYPLLTANCATCHAGAGPGTPSIAHPILSTAYDAVVNNQKVSFSNPVTSRLVQRLAADFHYCWSDCPTNAAEMQAAIVQWATLINFSGGGGGTVSAGSITSPQLGMNDGVEEVTGARYEDHVIGRWEFKEGDGAIAFDTSGVAPAMDLAVEGPTFMASYGIQIATGRAIATAAASRKLYDRIAEPMAGTQQYSVEAWVTPANVEQEGPARIITYSQGTNVRNFALGQVLYTYDFRNRSLDQEINGNGDPSLRTYDADEDLQATLQHVVMTFDQFRGRRIYVNARFTDDVDEIPADRLWNWDPNYRFALGNETSNNRQWQGQIRFVAIYDHALSDAQIQRNFEAGIGKKLRLRFDLSQWAGPGTILELSVSQLDAFSYLLCQPTFIGASAAGVRVKNLRVLVNGRAPVAGQAFTNVDTLVTTSPQELSPQCSVIAVDQGSELDRFSLEFELLGDFANVIAIGPPPPTPPVTPIPSDMPNEGLRDFHRVNETMASVTGVNPNGAAVLATFADVEQQLPGTFDLRTFSSSQQVGVAKLALEYCNELVDTPALRDAFFGTVPGFAWNAPVSTALAGQAERDVIIDALYARMIGSNVANQPNRDELATVLNTLFDQLTANCGVMVCDATRTRSIAKAACSAVLASAAVSIH